MTKRFLLLFMLLAICLSLVACSEDKDNEKAKDEEKTEQGKNKETEATVIESKGLEYELTSDGTAYTVIGIGECKDTEIVIPKIYEGLPVTAVGKGEENLYWNESVKSIIIPDSVTQINDCAFIGCSGLTNIVIPDSVTNIGRGAFGFCENLETVILPESITVLKDLTFGNCSKLREITIPASVLTIEQQTFFSCTSLEKVTVKNKNTVIEKHAFDDDSNTEIVYE